MKKLKEWEVLRLKRIADARFTARLRTKDKRYHRRTHCKREAAYLLESRGLTGRYLSEASNHGRVAEIDAPRKISLTENREELIKFCVGFRDLLKEGRDNVRINLTDVEDVDGPGLLYFVAHVYTEATLRKRRVNGNYPKNKEVLAIMQDLGFFRMVGAQEPLAPREEGERFRIMEFRTGKRVLNSEIGVLQDRLINHISDVEDDVAPAIYEVMVEAMQNVIDHAYRDDDNRLRKFVRHTLVDRWWVAAFLDRQDGRLLFMMCDLGAGIPITIRDTVRKGKAVITRAADAIGIVRLDDADYIEAAVMDGLTSTGKAHHGRGLRKMRRTTDRFPESSLSIFSRKGSFWYSSAQEKPRTKRYQDSLDGTMVVWSVTYNQSQEKSCDNN